MVFLLNDFRIAFLILFYEAVLQSFINFNKFLQREDPLIPVISEQQIKSILVKLASKFVVVSNIRTANEDLSKLQYANIVDQLLCNLVLNYSK